MSSTHEPAVDRPVFVIGTGRSGTTLFFNLLAFHPHFAWFSNYNARLPRWPWVALLSRVHELHGARSLLNLRWRWVPKPTESYEVLNVATDSVFTAHRALHASDVTEATRQRFRRLVNTHLRFQSKPRFLCKYTGLPRVDYVRSIFPDARFIHVYRDGRAVANSLKNVYWWANDLSAWRYGKLRAEYLREYLEADQEPIVLAGIAWKTLMEAIEEECGELPASQYLRVRYDKLIRDLDTVMEEVRCFCELPASDRFRLHLASQELSDMDQKWTSQLSGHEISLLEKTIGEHLARYDFVR